MKEHKDDDDDCGAFLRIIFTKFLKAQSYTWSYRLQKTLPYIQYIF